MIEGIQFMFSLDKSTRPVLKRLLRQFISDQGIEIDDKDYENDNVGQVLKSKGYYLGEHNEDGYTYYSIYKLVDRVKIRIDAELKTVYLKVKEDE